MRKPPRRPPAIVSPARFEAFTILMELERSASAHADDLLRGPRVSALTAQDRNLCTMLVLGTLRWQIRLDVEIRAFLAKPNARLDPAIRIALRLSLFQLHWTDRIPAHAAIGESVSLARLAGHQHASRMVNAVLRMLSEGPRPALAALPEVPDELAAATAHPQWLVERWVARYGFAAAQAICQNGQRQPQLALRIGDAADEAELVADGITLARGTILPAARRVLSGDVTATDAFRSGRVRIQDECSQLIAELGRNGERILDCCAAPGGKTLVLAELHPQATITALEISPARCEALKSRIHASRFATRIEVMQADASQLPAEPKYDFILADVPCSGTGTLGRNPEIRHRLRLEDLARQADRQRAILSAALHALKPGGHLLYSTCSLEQEENSGVVAAVVPQHPEIRQISLDARIAELLSKGRLSEGGAELLRSRIAPDGSVTLLPESPGSGREFDGFFIALLEKEV